MDSYETLHDDWMWLRDDARHFRILKKVIMPPWWLYLVFNWLYLPKYLMDSHGTLYDDWICLRDDARHFRILKHIMASWQPISVSPM